MSNTTEKPVNLEYSKYDEERKKDEQQIAKFKEMIAQEEKRIEEFRAKIESIKTDPEYTDEEKERDIAHYGDIIEFTKSTMELAKETIGLVEIHRDIVRIQKEDADEILKKGENLDPLTSDIEQEDKPPRRVN